MRHSKPRSDRAAARKRAAKRRGDSAIKTDVKKDVKKGTVEITDLEKWKAKGGNGYIEKLPKSPGTGDAEMLSALVSVMLAGFVFCAASRKKKA